MSKASVALISGGLSGGFALAGVCVSNWMAGRRERAAFGREAALDLAAMERPVWGDSWVDLNAQLQREEARWAVARVPADLVQAFHAISVACWRDLRQTVQRSGGEHAAIGTGLLEAREAVHEAARAYLLRSGTSISRKARKGRALKLVGDVLGGEP